MRALAKEAAVVARAVGIPAAVAESQVRKARALTGASWHLMEAVACRAEDASELERACRTSMGGMPGLRPWRDALALEAADGPFADAFDIGVHPTLLGDAADPAADADAAPGFVDAGAMKDLMSATAFWRNGVADGDPLQPLDLPVARLRRSVGAGAGRGGPPGSARGGPTGAGAPGAPYVFVSYARRDRARIDSVIDAIRASGVGLWIDDSLTPGDEWDERLESALLGSVGLLAFVSDNYARSKWCRRELKFADVMDKPIYAARWSVEPLGGGLDIIFASLQFVHAGAADPTAALVRALRPLFPGAGA
jgi:TIR domain